MDSSVIPAMNRKFSKPFYLLHTALFYLIVFPVNWLSRKLGFGSQFLSIIQKFCQGPRGGTRAFKSYTPTSHDIFVTTYVKSGTNWMLQIAHQIIFHGKGDFEHIHDVIPSPDMSGPFIKSIPLESELVQQVSPEQKRVIKTHLAAHYVPWHDEAHYLTVIRDPKEVFVSSYYFGLGIFGPLMPTLDAWFELYFTNDFPLDFGSTWAEHTASYWALRNKPNLMILSFNEMKQDLSGTVNKIASFLDVTLSSSEFADVVEKSSFTYMSHIDDKFRPMPKENTSWGKHMRMMRKGEKGNSQELLSSEQQNRIDKHVKSELQKLNSDFPYECFFNDQSI